MRLYVVNEVAKVVWVGLACALRTKAESSCAGTRAGGFFWSRCDPPTNKAHSSKLQPCVQQHYRTQRNRGPSRRRPCMENRDTLPKQSKATGVTRPAPLQRLNSNVINFFSPRTLLYKSILARLGSALSDTPRFVALALHKRLPHTHTRPPVLQPLSR